MPGPPTAVIRSITPPLTTFTIPFNRIAPLGYRSFVAAGNRATTILLSSGQILLLNPIPVSPPVRERLDALGGVHFIAADFGHHLSVAEYVAAWPGAKTIGVRGLERKRSDVRWDWIYGGEEELGERPEEVFRWEGEVGSVLFEGFITRAVAWLYRPSGTLVVSDLVMNLPAREQYTSSSAEQGPLSREFATRAHPGSIWFKRLIYWIATVDYALMRRDVKRVAQWDFQRIIPCHGEVITETGKEAWVETHRWFL
ncbi:hypothetical protein PMIN06_000745 [Paraphaeosphaeria minitans]